MKIDSLLRNIRNIFVKIIPENSIIFRYFFVFGLKIISIKRRKRREFMRIDIPITEHCNLNCTCCTAFSPIAQNDFINIEQLEKDLSVLAKIIETKIETIWLTGGEPLLHPNLTDIFQIIRTYFPKVDVSLLTNGILLQKITEDFWKSCFENNIKIYITRYPIKLDFEKLKNIASSFNVELGYLGGDNEAIKTMWKYPLDLKGKQPLKNSYKMCSQVNECIRIKNNRIFPCNTIACIENFNNYFNKNLELSPSDYLFIDKIQNLDEIFDFLILPKPFCRYCNRKGVQTGIKWKISERNIKEWS